MPWPSNSKLPAGVKKKYKSAKKRGRFRKTFNACAESGKYSEASCWRIAHASAQGKTKHKKREKVEKTKKVKKSR